jgi:hypothetical protein
MFTRGDGSMVSLQDAARRLQVPVDTVWKWITDGKLAAEVRPGRGLGMEYYLDPGEMKRAFDLRGVGYSPIDDSLEGETGSEAPNNVISLEFSDLSELAQPTAREPRRPSDATGVIENLRSEAISAIDRQVGREAAIGELTNAVETIMNTMLEAIDRAQDNNEGRLVAELESLRVRLSRQIQDRERNDLRLRDALVATKTELTSALEALRPPINFTFAHGVNSHTENHERIPVSDSVPQDGDASTG